jgi:hypothetical protein
LERRANPAEILVLGAGHAAHYTEPVSERLQGFGRGFSLCGQVRQGRIRFDCAKFALLGSGESLPGPTAAG